MFPASGVPKTLVSLAEHNGDIFPACVIVSCRLSCGRFGLLTVGGVLSAATGRALDRDVKDVSFLSLAFKVFFSF